jgi:23S rRNA (guanine1835-N2)-methyltransferase
MKSCDTPFGELTLERWPPRPDDRMQAWDQADLLLLRTIHELGRVGKLLILNDNFGALTTALSQFNPVLWSDSEISRLAAQHNLTLNRDDTLSFVPGDKAPEGVFELVVCRVPKSLTLWQHQLTSLRDNLSSESLILAAGMTKHLPNRAQELMDKCLGQAERHLAVKKARILEARLDPASSPPALRNSEYKYQEFVLRNLPNLFSRTRVDEGTSLLISTLGDLSEKEEVLDLGCGNGLIGLVLQNTMPKANLTFIDESFQAVSCARLNFEQYFDKKATFLVADGLAEYTEPPFDLITLNPPFHQGHLVGDDAAWRLLQSAYQHLKKGGELRMVGNRHLAYHAKLKRIFQNCQVVESNRKFVVLSAFKQR